MKPLQLDNTPVYAVIEIYYDEAYTYVVASSAPILLPTSPAAYVPVTGVLTQCVQFPDHSRSPYPRGYITLRLTGSGTDNRYVFKTVSNQ